MVPLPLMHARVFEVFDKSSYTSHGFDHKLARQTPSTVVQTVQTGQSIAHPKLPERQLQNLQQPGIFTSISVGDGFSCFLFGGFCSRIGLHAGVLFSTHGQKSRNRLECHHKASCTDHKAFGNRLPSFLKILDCYSSRYCNCFSELDVTILPDSLDGF